MEIMRLTAGSTLELKKPHPCSSHDFRVVRVGSICRVICLGCGRDMDIDRIKLEKAIKHIKQPQENA